MKTIADDIFDLKQKRKGANGRAKGTKAELRVAQLFTAWTGKRFSRVPASGGLRFFKDNGITGDIVPPRDFYFPFNIEVKFYKDLGFNTVGKSPIKLQKGKILKFWEQSCVDAGIEKEPLLICRDNDSKDYFLFTKKDLGLEAFVGICELPESKLWMYSFERIIGTFSYLQFKNCFAL